MPESHSRPTKPSPLLVLIALAIVHRLRPAWCAITLQDAARSESVRPEQLSRLCSRAIPVLEPIVARLKSIGRPGRPRAMNGAADDLAITKSILNVATKVLGAIKPRRRRIAREIIVGAWLRLQATHPSLQQAAFADALALPARTLRSWLEHEKTSPRSSTSSPAPAPKKKRRKRRPRFQFDCYVPDLQFAGDTTDLEAFGVGLKLIGIQDVGGRDQDLFDSVIVDDRESSKRVIAAATPVLRNLPGAQFLTDQGTPYMAERTREALRALEIEHAPQKEGDAPGKATIERAFGLLKPILAPIFALTNSIATAVPQLNDKELAKASAHLLVTALLRAYQAGARATKRAIAARENHSAESLAQIAESAREHARATDRSSRLFLEHVHDIYIRRDRADAPAKDDPEAQADNEKRQRSRQRFVDSLRRYPVEALQEAERRFRSQVHRRDIRDRASYFAKLVRDANDALKKQRLREGRGVEQRERITNDIERVRAADAINAANPIGWLRRGLELIAAQWVTSTQTLIAGGAGLGLVHLRGAIRCLVEAHGSTAATDIATTVLRDFAAAHQTDLQQPGIAAVQQLLERLLPRAPTYDDNLGFASPPAIDILVPAGKTGHRQPADLLST